MIAVAPGKLMLAGEYAVLRGHPALVMAVTRHAVARVQAGTTQPPEVLATLALARREGYLTGAHADIALDCSRLAGAGGMKLGLGSSAAGCVAALALARALEGHAVSDRLAIGRLARRGHREAQGGGSGVDVLASALGGVQHIAVGAGDAEPAVSARRWPAEWPWRVLWTGASARTSEMLTKVAALEARDRGSVEACMQGIAEATTDLEDALERSKLDAAVRAVRAHGEWMAELGRRAGVAIVTEALQRFIAEGTPLGVGVKPSGAGGGDVALVIGQDEGVLAEALARAVRAGFVVLDLAPDTEGVRILEGEMEDR